MEGSLWGSRCSAGVWSDVAAFGEVPERGLHAVKIVAWPARVRGRLRHGP